MNIFGASVDNLDELAALEKLGFPGSEAASREALEYRLTKFPEYFLTVREGEKIIGLIDGVLSDKKIIDDDVYPPGGGLAEGKNLMILGLVVHPDYRKRGIAADLMNILLDTARRNGVTHVALTCKKELISYYERFGFINKGVSCSVIGDIVWYDMVLDV